MRSQSSIKASSRLTAGRGFDVVIDTITGDNLPNSFAALGYEGRIATTVARTTQDLGLLYAKARLLRAGRYACGEVRR